jgi:hypothetical protein
VSAPRRRPTPGREDTAGGPREWSAADEAWFARLLAERPPLSEWQRERLRALLDLNDETARQRPERRVSR